MNNNTYSHDFLTVGDLKSFNEKVDTSHEFDDNRFESFLVKPSEIDDDFMFQLSDIIDKKAQLDQRDNTGKAFKAPNTVDRLLASEHIAYITENGVAVAVASLIDPTKENYKGIIPADFYSLKSATNLEGRLQQEFFTVVDEKKGLGLAKELRQLLESESPLMFITIPVTDKDTIAGVASNGYKLVSEFDTDWEIDPVQLWIN